MLQEATAKRGHAFTVNGAPAAQDWVVVGTGLTVRIKQETGDRGQESEFRNQERGGAVLVFGGCELMVFRLD
jgi:uncharacterized protein with beta-barrel porin domain